MTTQDVSHTLAAKSDQLNAVDLSEPITVMVEKVMVLGKSEDQPVHIHLAGEEHAAKPYKPCKTMRRILARLWGADAAQWIGRQMTLYTDPAVKWGGQAVGGIRISHLSHIQGVQEVSTMYARGKFAPVTIRPLKAAAKKTTPPAEPPASVDEYTAFLQTIEPLGWDAENIQSHCQAKWQIDPRTLPIERLIRLAETLKKEKSDA